jgi:hypothetical protein
MRLQIKLLINEQKRFLRIEDDSSKCVLVNNNVYKSIGVCGRVVGGSVRKVENFSDFLQENLQTLIRLSELKTFTRCSFNNRQGIRINVNGNPGEGDLVMYFNSTCTGHNVYVKLNDELEEERRGLGSSLSSHILMPAASDRILPPPPKNLPALIYNPDMEEAAEEIKRKIRREREYHIMDMEQEKGKAAFLKYYSGSEDILQTFREDSISIARDPKRQYLHDLKNIDKRHRRNEESLRSDPNPTWSSGFTGN